jgi:hypothetical protein
MRNLILLGTIIATLAFGSVSAKSFANPAEIAASNSVGPTAMAAAEIIDSGWASASDIQASAAQLHWVGRSVGENTVIVMRDVTLVAMGALVLGLCAVCAKARRDAVPARSQTYGRPAAV